MNQVQVVVDLKARVVGEEGVRMRLRKLEPDHAFEIIAVLEAPARFQALDAKALMTPEPLCFLALSAERFIGGTDSRGEGARSQVIIDNEGGAVGFEDALQFRDARLGARAKKEVGEAGVRDVDGAITEREG